MAISRPAHDGNGPGRRSDPDDQPTNGAAGTDEQTCSDEANDAADQREQHRLGDGVEPRRVGILLLKIETHLLDGSSTRWGGRGRLRDWEV